LAERHQIRDPVHNFVELWEKEIKLVGTPIFQRLRGIRQSAMANLVYPGALHTRFDHSLGVCHVAGLLSKQLGLNENSEAPLVRLAALLHDLGHGPFSHVSESLLERYADRSKLPLDQRKEKIHELVTAHLIKNDPDILRIVGAETCDEIVKLLSEEGHGQPAMRAIVSGPLDADKQDYLLRDSLFCGVEYGVFELHQLHRSLVLDGPEDEKELMIDLDGIHAVEQYVLAKYYLTTNVYRHKVRLITDQMIIRAIVLGIEEDRLEDLHSLYAFDNSPGFYGRYTRWNDARLMAAFGLENRPDTRCGRLFDRLQDRRLFKRVYRERIQKFADVEVKNKLLTIGGRARTDEERKANETLRKEIEAALAEILSAQFYGHDSERVDALEVILHVFDIKSVRTTSRNEESGIPIATRGAQVFFQDESALFASINESYTEAFVEVYAPTPAAWGDRTRRSKWLKALAPPIHEAIQSIVRPTVQGAS
jgi:HD superfamily phosphohydrolase